LADIATTQLSNVLAGCVLTDSIHAQPKFETVLAELSATFVNLPADEVDSQIESGLRRLVEFLGMDRGSLAEHLLESRQLAITHSYHVPGAPPNPRFVLDEQLPWYTNAIHRGDPLRLVSLPDDLPHDATLEREYCLRVGMKSHVMIPLKVVGAIVGAIGFASFRGSQAWPDELIQRLRLVGEIFTNALARKRGEQALKKAEEQARELRDELAHATRLELVDHLTASIAHEVNQPLCAISSNAQTALELLRMGEIEEAKLALQDIWGDAKRGSEMIGRLRSMVKKDVSSRVPVGVASVIDEITPLLHREATALNVLLTIELNAADVIVECDRVQIQQVVLNLVLNAFDAVTLGSAGPLEVKIRVDMDEIESVHISVQDSGTGLSAQDCDRVFAPFFTTKAKGLGMGLAISRSIVQSHGGVIWATPGAEVGSTFHFRLPAISGNSP
jgi:signal transduction histidine kinase